MKRERILSKFVGRKKLKENESKFFVFCEKTGSKAQFQADTACDVNNAVERMAGLLAIQCLVKGHDPDDFVVLVPADSTLSGRMLSRAKQLLHEGRAALDPPSLSPRQSEILHSVIRNQANKEIASRLNITVRTVKFHISSLLNKFGVENRGELARRASGLMASIHTESSGSSSANTSGRDVRVDGARGNFARNPIDVPLRATNKALNLRFPGSALSA